MSFKQKLIKYYGIYCTRKIYTYIHNRKLHQYTLSSFEDHREGRLRHITRPVFHTSCKQHTKACDEKYKEEDNCTIAIICKVCKEHHELVLSLQPYSSHKSLVHETLPQNSTVLLLSVFPSPSIKWLISYNPIISHSSLLLPPPRK